MMCQNYEKQLQRLQKELVAVQDKEKLLIDNVKKLQVCIFNIGLLNDCRDKLAHLSMVPSRH